MSSNPSQNPSNWPSQGNTASNYSNSQAYANPGDRKQEHAQFPITLSGEELRTLKECNKESFYYRCLPLSTLFSGLAFMGMKSGYLTKSPNYGYGPKVLLGVFLGYVGGKYSYRKECMEKILKLPDSQLAESIRKNQGMSPFTNSLNVDPSHTSTDFSTEGLVLEDRKPDFSEHNDGIDSYNKVAENLSPYVEGEAKGERSSYTSYEELRRTNRQDYNNKVTEKYRRQSSTEPSRSDSSSFPGTSTFPDSSFGSSTPSYTESSHSSVPPPRDDDLSSSTSVSRPTPYFNPKKNKYGDVWDN